MLGAPFALASQFPSIRPRDVHDFHKKMMATKDLISNAISTSTTMHKDERRVEDVEPCADVGSELFWQMIDAVGNSYYDGIECSPDFSECTWDLSEPVSNGAFNTAAGICQSDGGTLYMIDAVIDCDDGTTNTIIANPLACLAACSAEMLDMSTAFIPAAPFAGKDENAECSWTSFKAYSVEASTDEDDIVDDEVTGGEDDYFGDDEVTGEDDYFDDDQVSGICAPVETEAYNNVLLPIFFAYAFTPVCDESVPPTCTYDFSEAVESGSMDALLPPCSADGGELYLASYGIDCADQGLTEYDQFPLCLKSCDETYFQFFFPEGGDADGPEGNCTFTDSYDVSIYGGDTGGDDAVEEVDDAVEEEDDDISGGICEPVESEAYGLALFLLMFSSMDGYVCDETETNCTLDMTFALEGDMMDGVTAVCAAEGGEVFISTFTVDCGEDGITSHINFPMCFTSCSADYLVEYVVVEGGPADGDEDCIFSEVGEIYPLVLENEDDGFSGDDTTDGDDEVAEDDTTPTDDATDGDDMVPKSSKSPKSPKMAKGSKSVKKTAKKTKAPKAM